MRSIEEQRNVEIRQGFSPKPLAPVAVEMGVSPSLEPESPSPKAILDAPLIQRADLTVPASSDVIVRDGIVSFGK